MRNSLFRNCLRGALCVLMQMIQENSVEHGMLENYKKWLVSDHCRDVSRESFDAMLSPER